MEIFSSCRMMKAFVRDKAQGQTSPILVKTKNKSFVSQFHSPATNYIFRQCHCLS